MLDRTGMRGLCADQGTQGRTPRLQPLMRQLTLLPAQASHFLADCPSVGPRWTCLVAASTCSPGFSGRSITSEDTNGVVGLIVAALTAGSVDRVEWIPRGVCRRAVRSRGLSGPES